MQKPSARALLILGSLTASAPALAHPGHNHAHWSSAAVHGLYFLAVAGVIAAGISLYKLNRNKRQDDQHPH